MRRILPIVLALLLALAPLTLAACGTTTPDLYTMTLVYEPSTRSLAGEMTVQLENRTESAWETVKFQLWPNAFREGAKYLPVSETYAPAVYYKGASFGGITLTGIEGGEARVVGEDENILEVTPPAPVYPDERITLTMRFTVLLPEIEHRLGVGQKTVNLGNFYPILCAWGEEGFCEHVYACCGDPFVSGVADYDVTFSLPASYHVAHTGTGTRTEENGLAAYHVRAEGVRDFAMVCSEQFTVHTAEASGIPVMYYALDDADPSGTLQTACESLSYYADAFGAYEYPAYTVVETGFPYGGMEYPMLSLIADDLPATEVPLVVAHETAHQWWYAMVGSDQYHEAWQDEGLAEYSAALFFEAYPEYGRTYADMVAASESAYRAYYSVSAQLSRGETAMRRDLTDYTGDYAYRSLAYDKGVILFDRLRQTVGEERFFAAIKDYARAYKGEIAPPEALIARFAARSPQAEGIFAAFLDGLCVI